MIVIEPSFHIENLSPDILQRIEQIGRVCYKSEDKITDFSATKFISMILDPTRRHESVIEHISMSVRFICDRGVSHEIVRHRLASYSQESTRYCNYSKNKFGGEITVIDPRPFISDGPEYDIWLNAIRNAEKSYFRLLENNKPQMARSVLPNSLKTEIVMTANLREWRHFFTLRTAKTAHPQMRQLACPLLKDVRNKVPIIFDDVGIDEWEENV